MNILFHCALCINQYNKHKHKHTAIIPLERFIKYHAYIHASSKYLNLIWWKTTPSIQKFYSIFHPCPFLYRTTGFSIISVFSPIVGCHVLCNYVNRFWVQQPYLQLHWSISNFSFLFINLFLVFFLLINIVLLHRSISFMNEMKYKLLFAIHRCPKNIVSIRIREDISYSHSI